MRQWLLLGVIMLAGCRWVTPAGPVPAPTTPTPVGATAVPPTPTPVPATSANADVLFVRAAQAADESWNFSVTVAHPDTGWDDYADGWNVVLPNGTVLKPDPDSPFTRLLLHPHETEQPFTRSQGGVVIPAGVAAVRVRAHDLVDGFGGQEIVLDWTAVAAGTAVSHEDYEIIPYTP